ncbi:MAG: hypothetical protein EOP09_03695 [Proteobacteria bacterium]|nr:MAG: hypothetical protein EOP09_03695 [Pseudomonadota bacterium]
MNKKMLILGAAAAGIMAASQASAAPGEKAADMGECHGINSCKGKGQCGSSQATVGGDSKHECGGRNECKGKGWVRMSKKVCDTKKGKWQKFVMEM